MNHEEYFKMSEEINTRELAQDEKLYTTGYILFIYNTVTLQIDAYLKAAANSDIVKHDHFIMTVNRLGMEYLDRTMYDLVKEVYEYFQGR